MIVLASELSSTLKDNIYNNSSIQIVALIVLICAIVHTFFANSIANFSNRFQGIWKKALHLIGEIEVVFGFWAIILILYIFIVTDHSTVVFFLTEDLSYIEACFIFTVVIVASTKPLIYFSRKIINIVSKALPFNNPMGAFLFTVMIVGPLMGSFITEPAAITLTALLLKEQILDKKEVSFRFKYAIISVLFVNISIGGILTNFAAPPVLVVANTWNWSTPFMFINFGWKAIIITVINSSILYLLFKKECSKITLNQSDVMSEKPIPFLVIIIQGLFLVGVVFHSHYIPILFMLLLLFLAWCNITSDYQSKLEVKNAILVSFFIGGLITIGKLQGWWLESLFMKINSDLLLNIGTIFLTALMDNAAITFLGSQVPNISDSFKYFLVAGAVTGGGLTVIANAPNPIGWGILKDSYNKGVSLVKIFTYSLIPTFIAFLILYFL